MKNISKYILLVSIILVVIVIIIISILIYVLKNNNIEAPANEYESEYHYHGNEEKKSTLQQVVDARNFYTVENCINIYIDNVVKNDKQAINNLLDKSNKNNNIPSYNVEKENIAQKMWTIDNSDNISSYYVYTKIRNKNTLNISNEQDYYFTVILDSNNSTFAILPNGNQYSEDDLNSISAYANTEIKVNQNNIFEDILIYNEDIIKKYFNEFVKNALYKSEYAYELLNEQYRNQKFSGIDNFRKYIDNNKMKLQYARIERYTVQNFSSYTEYTIIDNYNNYYIIKENNVMDYEMFLDDYTIQSNEFIEKYKNSSDEVKISTNVDKIFKMINTKSYNEIYTKYLNENFKNNYFNNYQSFSEFINSEFFDTNYIENISFDKQVNNYIVTIKYKEDSAVAALSNKCTIIMRLKENNSFEFSFQIN